MTLDQSYLNSSQNRGWVSSMGERQGRYERASAATLVLLLHGAAIALVMLVRSPKPVDETRRLATFDVALADQQPRRSSRRAHPSQVALIAPMAPALPEQVAPVDPAPPAAISAMPAVSLTAAATPATPATAAGGCDLTQPVQDALVRSEEVRRQLPAIPTDARSVANAVVVWNAGWADPGTTSSRAAFAAIRQTIIQAAAGFPADCRNQIQLGPRLLYVPGTTATTTRTAVLAVGSGQWTWQQLIDGQALPSGNAIPAQAAPVFAANVSSAAASGAGAAMNALLASLIHTRSPAVFH